jgi:PKD repeat protein
VLNPKPTTCDGFTVNFKNDNLNDPPGTEYFWTFGEPLSGNLDTSILATPSHTYMSAGTFTVRLRVSLAGGICADTASFQVNVFPGFRPDFTAAGGCVTRPFQFNDLTETDYGVVDTWSWDFGDLTTLGDTSHLQNPQWTYSTPGPKTVTLTVTNSKGCVDTKQVNINVLAKPTITLAFNDALICIPDSITLNASGTGTFNWTPNVRIINANTSSPTVYPIVDTWYVVNLNDNGVC